MMKSQPKEYTEYLKLHHEVLRMEHLNKLENTNRQSRTRNNGMPASNRRDHNSRLQAMIDEYKDLIQGK